MKSKSKELKLCEHEHLFRFPYTWRHPIENLKCIPTMIVRAYQRFRYGISRYDAWDLDSFLFVVLENGLKYLKDAGNSYPGWCTYEEWHHKLDYMIKLSEISNLFEDEVTEKSFDKMIKIESEYGRDSEQGKKARDKWFEDVKSFDDSKHGSKKKLLKELEKYVNDLWD